MASQNRDLSTAIGAHRGYAGIVGLFAEISETPAYGPHKAQGLQPVQEDVEWLQPRIHYPAARHRTHRSEAMIEASTAHTEFITNYPLNARSKIPPKAAAQ